MLVKARVGFEEPVELADHSAEARVVRDYLEGWLAAPKEGCRPLGGVERPREVDETEWQGGRVYLHLGARRDDPPHR
jgi:hypothetical protein